MNNNENTINLNARMLMLVSSLLFAAMPVSGIMLYKFIDVIPKMYFVVFITLTTVTFGACSILSALAGEFPKKGLMRAANIVFFSAIGLFCVAMIAVMVIFLIFM